MIPRHVVRSVALLTAVVLAVAGCSDSSGSTADDPTGEDRGAEGFGDGTPSVVVVGDSITFMSSDLIREELTAAGVEVLEINAQVGRRMLVGVSGGVPYSGVDIIDFIANGTNPPDLWVVALGANDVGSYTGVDRYAEVIAELVSHVPDGAPIVWVDTWHRNERERAEQLNEAARSVLDDRDDTLVVPWSDHGEDEGIIEPDGVHPTPAGSRLFAELIAQGVRDLAGDV